MIASMKSPSQIQDQYQKPLFQQCKQSALDVMEAEDQIAHGSLARMLFSVTIATFVLWLSAEQCLLAGSKTTKIALALITGAILEWI